MSDAEYTQIKLSRWDRGALIEELTELGEKYLALHRQTYQDHYLQRATRLFAIVDQIRLSEAQS